MIRRRRLLALGLTAALPALTGVARAVTAVSSLNPFEGIATVEVFCNSAMLIEQVQHPPFQQTVYRLDALDQMQRALNQRMPQTRDEQQAYQWVMQNEAQIKRAFAPVAAQTANAINLARYYHIDHLPAIVVNRQSVVYGITDVADAIARFQAHLQQKGG